FDELRNRMAKGTIKMRIEVQVAGEGDVVENSTIQWPSERPLVEFGTVELDAVAAENDSEQKRIIFDPIPRLPGIASSGDPLLDPRANLYLASGRRRRSAG